MNTLSDAYREQARTLLSASALIPVIAIQDPDDALPLCRALVAGGVRVLEITLRTEHGLRAIEAVREALPEAWVGAGTVTSVAQYRQVESAGAQFVITPGVTESILEYGVNARAPLLPGVSTASELMMGYALGYRAFKFFPAVVAGGVAALKALRGPFPDVVFCPTGGVTRHTASDYLALPNVRAVGGSWLTPAELVARQDWNAVSDLVRGSLADL